MTFPISTLAPDAASELVAYSWIFPNVVPMGHWWYSNIPATIAPDLAARLQALPKVEAGRILLRRLQAGIRPAEVRDVPPHPGRDPGRGRDPGAGLVGRDGRWTWRGICCWKTRGGSSPARSADLTGPSIAGKDWRPGSRAAGPSDPLVTNGPEARTAMSTSRDTKRLSAALTLGLALGPPGGRNRPIGRHRARAAGRGPAPAPRRARGSAPPARAPRRARHRLHRHGLASPPAAPGRRHHARARRHGHGPGRGIAATCRAWRACADPDLGRPIGGRRGRQGGGRERSTPAAGPGPRHHRPGPAGRRPGAGRQHQDLRPASWPRRTPPWSRPQRRPAREYAREPPRPPHRLRLPGDPGPGRRRVPRGPPAQGRDRGREPRSPRLRSGGPSTGPPGWISPSSEWDRARALAFQFRNPNFRGQMLSKIAVAQAAGASRWPEASGRDSSAPSDRDRDQDPLIARADGLFKHAASQADGITRPVWHDHALEAIVAKAAAAGRFATRAGDRPPGRPPRDPGRRLPPRRRGRRPAATSSTTPPPTYAEAARAVASINLDDPRMVLGGILIDSLISTGRFDDARASIALLPSASRRRTALGAIAESQGRRGLADSAMAWIEPRAEPRNPLDAPPPRQRRHARHRRAISHQRHGRRPLAMSTGRPIPLRAGALRG